MLTDVGNCPTSVTCGDCSNDSLRAAAKRRLLACTRLRAQSQEEPFWEVLLREGQDPPLHCDLLLGTDCHGQFATGLAMTWYL